MANHAYVKSATPIEANLIASLLGDLNERLFKRCLRIDYHESDDSSAWGPHCWVLTFVSAEDGQEYAGRVCWLNPDGSFEIRHGGGSNFAWWIDHAITNEVAVRTNSAIEDDCDMDLKVPGVPDRYASFGAYACGFFQHVKTAEQRGKILADAASWIPPEFRDASILPEP